MAVDKKNAIYFAGGKTIQLQQNETDAQGIKFERRADGSWKVTLELNIVPTEAENVIRKFADLGVTESEVDDAFPNQVYFVAQDDSQEAIYLEMAESKMTVFFDKEEKGGITISMQPIATAKTQNPILP